MTRAREARRRKIAILDLLWEAIGIEICNLCYISFREKYPPHMNLFFDRSEQHFGRKKHSPSGRLRADFLILEIKSENGDCFFDRSTAGLAWNQVKGSDRP